MVLKEIQEQWFIDRIKLENELDLKSLKEKLLEIRKKSISNLENLIKKTIENLKKNGIKVYYAKNSEEAIKYFKEICKDEKIIVKSKSNVIKEIGLKNLEEFKFIETDCGDFIISLVNKKAVHPVLPSLNISIDEIKEKIKEKYGVQVSSIEEIKEFIKNIIKKEIMNAKIGLTGANVISSEGSIFILENEGNISLLSRLPEKHIIITSIDKIVETNEDAMTICKALPIFSLSKRSVAYVNVISSPSGTADIENKYLQGMYGAKEVHVILVDNNRLKAIKNGFEEIFYCIDCGGCLFACPIFLNDQFVNVRCGGIGIIKDYLIYGKLNDYSLLFKCTLCNRCKEVCPLNIDIAKYIRILRNKIGIENNTKNNIEMLKSFANNKSFDDLRCC